MQVNKKREWLGALTQENLPAQYHKLAEIIGMENALKLSEMWGGAAVYIPTPDAAYDAARRELIRRDYKRGAAVSTLARRYGVTERTVQRAVEDLRAEQISIEDLGIGD